MLVVFPQQKMNDTRKYFQNPHLFPLNVIIRATVSLLSFFKDFFMGYTTDFSGHFEISPALNPDQIDYLTAFSETRRMKRDPQVTASLPDKRRLAVGLPIGVEGEFL